jgi:diacylglycerol O-acyltransferase
MAATREQGWNELRHWGRERELGELDALMWRTERHPENSWTGVVALMLDSTPEWERLRRAHEWFVSIVPRFTERVVDPALPVGPSAWSPDERFDLDYHVRRVRLPEPGSRQQLLEYAQAVALTPMDRSRSPWVGTLVEGLQDGRAVYLLQAHHVLMDGMAVTQLFKRVMSPQRETTPNKPMGSSEEDFETLGPLDVTGRELARQASSTPRLLSAALRTAGRALRDPAGAARYTTSLAHVLAPPPANRSQVLRGGSRRVWRFGMLECQLSQLKAAGKVAGGTVNDTFVCVLLGGLRRYCAAMGEDLPDIPISMPVSMRKLDDAMGGNKFAGAFFAVPSSIADPVERIQEMRRRVEEVRSEPALDFLGNITPVLNRTPSGVAAALLGGINSRAVLTTSSWPGLTDDLFIAGAKFERMFVFAPLPGTVLTGAMCTHAGTCCIAINVDGEVIADPDLLWESMQASLDEILALADS